MRISTVSERVVLKKKSICMSATARKCGKKLSLEKGFDIRCYDACCFESLKRIAGVVRGDREQRAIRIGDHVEASGFAVLLVPVL